ncbi:hypothetical protein [Asaia bogorensis]|uniref:hypothetical protein n=1 Tax=Asaia bogorensis TaxID=91915 RepID=UPI0011BD8681|nr:hypothetical protein [Asaia bogorensis]
MFNLRAKLAACWVISAILGLAAGASIIVGISKSIWSSGYALNPVARLGFIFGSDVGIWEWYSDSGDVSDNLLSGIGIVSLIALVIGLAGGWFSSRRLAELNQVSRSLRTERLQNKYRGR